MQKLLTIIIILFLANLIQLDAVQRPNKSKKMGRGSIEGSLFRKESEKPIAYATLRLYRLKDSTLVTGAMSKKDGSFLIDKVPGGKYYLNIKFIGFSTKTIDNITVNRKKNKVNLGKIHLDRDFIQTQKVVVEVEKQLVEFKTDRKVINVDQSLAASSGTAVDVLENVPSVEVDLDGDVSLRGSSGFIVMIDGRPSILDPNDALKQIPASSIENIEIITNPSAKFDPDGTSGILNIILKKQKYEGSSSLYSINLGQHNRFGGSVLLNYKQKSYNLFLGADYNQNERPGSAINRNETYLDGVTTFVNSNGDRNNESQRYGVRGGIEFDLSEKDKLSLQTNIGYRERKGSNKLNFEEWTSVNTTVEKEISDQSWSRGGNFYSATMDYFKSFDSPLHNLTAQVDFSRRIGDEESKDEMFDVNNDITFASAHTEKGPSTRLRAKIDYIYPIKENHKLELGYQSRFGVSEDVTESFGYNYETNQYFLEEEFSHSIEYRRNIHSLYSMYSGEYNKFGYQAGLRGEYTDRIVELRGESNQFTIDRWDIFPTAHMSYSFNEDLQAMTSYARRIERPRSWYLEPFTTKSDAFNYRTGNPDLNPEYINSFELGILKYFGSNSLSLEGYHRSTENKVERIKTLIDPLNNIFLNSIANVGTDYATGVELMLNYKPFKVWSSTLSSSVYNYRIETTKDDQVRNFESTNWNMRFKNNFDLTKSTKFELAFNYNSPSVSSQGEREGSFTSNAAVRQSLFDKSLSAVLQVRDIFGTSKNESTTIGESYRIYTLNERNTPTISLTLKYNLNNFKQKKKSDGDDGDDF